ncbi:phosphate/phosphite/phosphonate ABC transporter substrate-binding protein [Marinomonas sp. C2222]|uniref:Phosphate/phosphite/phosphonate ABC transporter substrate-binding protein n=1 Tax=Marinomonas sargassi TaxID=2984494 RepID=A0ABT2YUA0_9GAMM|nr:phosphate/phosphite/phosphonate ABC transporter substrate-binding protein [Marinomonas sargassi]MCV2403472.1 phosphate/phosphite/phosphonate ABC transporter substrate-binding protein [Marinomonas sargassi]
MKKLVYIALLIFGLPIQAQDRVFTFGIVPQQSAITLAKNWGPILQHLSKETGYKIVFRTAKDIPEFEQRVLKGEYDIAYMNPYHYTVFNKKPGYQAFAKQKDKLIYGIIVTRTDSPIKGLKELDGETLVFPSPAAFAASVVPRSSIAAMGINFTPQYVSSHDSVYLNVSKGFFPAGGGIERTLNNTNSDVRDSLKVLWRTPGYTPHAFATHPSLPEAVRSKVVEKMLAMNNSKEGLALLERIKFKGLESAENSDWDDVRSLNITLLDSLLEP